MYGLNSDFQKRDVAIYARVSTEHEAQLSALENQIDWYKPILEARPDWTLTAQYIDATVIIGLKQNPTHGRRFSPVFLLKSGILWGKTQNATTKRRKTEYGMG